MLNICVCVLALFSGAHIRQFSSHLTVLHILKIVITLITSFNMLNFVPISHFPCHVSSSLPDVSARCPRIILHYFTWCQTCCALGPFSCLSPEGSLSSAGSQGICCCLGVFLGPAYLHFAPSSTKLPFRSIASYWTFWSSASLLSRGD